MNIYIYIYIYIYSDYKAPPILTTDIDFEIWKKEIEI